MKGKLDVTKYVKTKNKWEIKETEIDVTFNIDADRWLNWAKLDKFMKAFTRVELGKDGTLLKYTVISPDKIHKTVYINKYNKG
jgi:hypothetical protein